MAKFRQRLDDAYIQVFRDFREDSHHEIWDTHVRQLRVNIGERRTTFTYFEQHRRHGKRSTTCIVLGHFPQMSVSEARKAAKIIAGRTAAGRVTPGKRAAVKFADALADYLLFLKAKAERKGKAPRWWYNVNSLGNSILLPEFAKWPLSELSHNPAAVRDAHIQATRDHGPIVANRAFETLRTCYKHAAKLNRSLPPASPCSAVLWNVEKPRETGILDFVAWADAWRKIESPSRRAFHLCGLLTGARPGELSRVTPGDIDLKKRTLTFRQAKGGRDYTVPLSWPILRCLRHVEGFGAARRNPVRDGLPVYGHALRHANASTARALGIDPLLVKILMGHSLGSADVTEGYMSSEMLRAPLRAAQRLISAELMAQLGLITMAAII